MLLGGVCCCVRVLSRDIDLGVFFGVGVGC